MTPSYPYKVAKSSRQNSRPKPHSVSAVARASKLEEALTGHSSHSLVPSQSSDHQTWESSTSFQPYTNNAESVSSHLNSAPQAPAYDNQEPLDLAAYPSPTSNPPPTATHFSIDHAPGQFEFKSQAERASQAQDTNYQDMR
jgi:hypothetical protein